MFLINSNSLVFILKNALMGIEVMFVETSAEDLHMERKGLNRKSDKLANM